MEPQRIIRATGIAAFVWVGITVVGLVRGASGPSPDPTQLLLRLTVGPLALLLVGNVLAWLVNRLRMRAGPGPSAGATALPRCEPDGALARGRTESRSI